MSDWKSSFVKGFSTCFTICSVIAGVAIYFNATILSIKEEEIVRLNTEVSKREDFSEKYHQELTLRRQLELREAELKEQLAIVESKKWEEKYLSEHLANQTLEEQVALLEVRNNDLRKSIKDNSNDPKKDLVIQSLQDELKLTKNELVKLRSLYTEVKKRSAITPNKTIKQNIQNTSENERIFNLVKASIPSLGSTKSKEFLISTYRNTNRKITITQLSQVIYQMGSTNTLETIKAISSNIINNNDPKALQRVLDNMGSTNSEAALKHLIK